MSAGCGHVGVLIGSELLPAGRPPAMPWREGFGVVMVSEALIRRWETVYAEYGLASEMVNNSEPGDRAIARRMAEASGNVALVWRQMADEPGIPWWSMAALSAAAQAFEFQARDWTARTKYDVQSAGASRIRDGRDVYPHRSEHGPARSGWCGLMRSQQQPATLAEAHDVLRRQRPKRDAGPREWVAFHRHSAQVYSETAKVDLRHQHEATQYAGIEIRRAREIEDALNPSGDDA